MAFSSSLLSLSLSLERHQTTIISRSFYSSTSSSLIEREEKKITSSRKMKWRGCVSRGERSERKKERRRKRSSFSIIKLDLLLWIARKKRRISCRGLQLPLWWAQDHTWENLLVEFFLSPSPRVCACVLFHILIRKWLLLFRIVSRSRYCVSNEYCEQQEERKNFACMIDW